MYYHLLAVNPNGLFNAWRETALSWLNALVDAFMIPIAIVIAAAILIYNVIKIIKIYTSNRGEDFLTYVWPIVICAVVIGILATKGLWWGFITGGAI